jgi:4-hydroxy-2-oxoheptanedioate aldolase
MTPVNNTSFTPTTNRELRAGGAAVLTGLTTASPTAAEHLATVGFDGLIIDLQHGDIDASSALVLAQAITLQSVIPLARIPSLDPGLIGRLLDSGITALICPMVESRKEVEAFIRASYYPPIGARSFGPLRPVGDVGAIDYAMVANNAVLTLIQIETAAGLENVDEILSTPGLSGVYIGPTDLGRSLGEAFRADWTEGPVPAAISKIVQAARLNGLIVGIYSADPAFGRELLDQGLDFVVTESDITFMLKAARASLATLRGNETGK